MREALRHLERRPRTVSEARRHLEGRGHSKSVVSAVLRKLARMGYLDDGAYAERLCARATQDKPRGRVRLAHELARAGLDRATIETSLRSAFGPAQEAEALRAAIRRARRGRAARSRDTEVRRVAGYLLRRGFGAEQVRVAVEDWATSADWDLPDPAGMEASEES